MSYKIIYPDELYHFGVKGMKWGVRRYQNADGSLNARGRRRQRDDAIQTQYEKAERKIESKYRRGQLLSERDNARLNRADQAARDAWKASKDQYKTERREERAAKPKMSTKKKVAIGAAVVAGTALAAYGGYKVYKLHGEARVSLGHRYISLSKNMLDLANNADISAGNSRIEARRYGDRFKATKSKIDYEGMKSYMDSTRELYKQADRYRDDAARYIDAAANNRYSKKEVAREMADIARSKLSKRR